MNRVFSEDIPGPGARVVLAEAETRHLVRVRRALPGSEVSLFDGRGREATGRLVSVDRRRATVELLDVRTAPPDAPVHATLVTAIPKGTRMGDLVRACTEVGVAEVRPVVVERSAVRPPPGLRLQRWERVAREAATQSRRGTIPAIAPVACLEEALQGSEGCDVRIVGEAGPAARPAREVLAARTGCARAMIAVGPEGGFTDAEIAVAAARGFEAVRLDTPVMRVETAAPVLLAVVMYACA